MVDPGFKVILKSAGKFLFLYKREELNLEWQEFTPIKFKLYALWVERAGREWRLSLQNIANKTGLKISLLSWRSSVALYILCLLAPEPELKRDPKNETEFLAVFIKNLKETNRSGFLLQPWFTPILTTGFLIFSLKFQSPVLIALSFFQKVWVALTHFVCEKKLK